ncbi:hypothetical protein D3C80_1352210 [compost metagenome]
MTGAGLLPAGHFIQGRKAQVAGEYGVYGNGTGYQDQKWRDRTNQHNHLLHIQTDHGDHQQSHQHAACQRRHAKLLLQQCAATRQHHHRDREHEEGDHQVDEQAQVAPADGVHHILVRDRLKPVAKAGQGHAEKSEQRRADQGAEQPPEAEVDEEQQQLTPGGETCTDDDADKRPGNFQLLLHV